MTRATLALLLLLAAPAFGDEPATLPSATPLGFSAAATPDKVALGERFLYRIEVQDLPSIQYTLAQKPSLGESFEVIDQETKRLAGTQGTTTRIDLSVALFALGEHNLADLTLLATTPEGPKVLVIPGPPVTGIEKSEQPGKAEALPPVDMKIPDYSLILWVLGAAAIVAAGVFLVRRLSRRPEKPLPTVVVPAIPPHERALAALSALEREALFDAGRTREHWFRLSEIVRAYLGERFEFGALDMTTEELLDACRVRQPPMLDLVRFEAFCRHADLAKFARAEPDRDSCVAALAEARALVEATS